MIRDILLWLVGFRFVDTTSKLKKVVSRSPILVKNKRTGFYFKVKDIWISDNYLILRSSNKLKDVLPLNTSGKLNVSDNSVLDMVMDNWGYLNLTPECNFQIDKAGDLLRVACVVRILTMFPIEW